MPQPIPSQEEQEFRLGPRGSGGNGRPPLAPDLEAELDNFQRKLLEQERDQFLESPSGNHADNHSPDFKDLIRPGDVVPEAVTNDKTECMQLVLGNGQSFEEKETDLFASRHLLKQNPKAFENLGRDESYSYSGLPEADAKRVIAAFENKEIGDQIIARSKDSATKLTGNAQKDFPALVDGIVDAETKAAFEKYGAAEEKFRQKLSGCVFTPKDRRKDFDFGPEILQDEKKPWQMPNGASFSLDPAPNGLLDIQRLVPDQQFRCDDTNHCEPKSPKDNQATIPAKTGHAIT